MTWVQVKLVDVSYSVELNRDAHINGVKEKISPYQRYWLEFKLDKHPLVKHKLDLGLIFNEA